MTDIQNSWCTVKQGQIWKFRQIVQNIGISPDFREIITYRSLTGNPSPDFFSSKGPHVKWRPVDYLDCLGHLLIKGTNGRQKTSEIFHVYSIFYSGFISQTTVIFGITKDGSLVLNTLASWNCFTCRNLSKNGANNMSECLTFETAFCKKAQNFVQFGSSDFDQISQILPACGKHSY